MEYFTKFLNQPSLTTLTTDDIKDKYYDISLNDDTFSWINGKHISYDSFLNSMVEVDKIKSNKNYVPKLKINIKTNGNDISTFLAIANVISQHEAETIAIVDRHAFSGGTLLCLLCDKIEMKEYALLGRISAYNHMPFNSTHILKAEEALNMSWTKVVFEYLLDKEKSIVDQFKKILLRKYTENETNEIIQFFMFTGSHNMPIYYDQLPEIIKRKVTITKIESSDNTGYMTMQQQLDKIINSSDTSNNVLDNISDNVSNE
jgi:hypothetical protein